MRLADGTAELDGVTLPVERLENETIIVEARAGNAVGAPRGRHEAVGCGIWVRIAAVAPGQHTLRIRGSADDFAVSVNYKLTVLSPAG